ncbi:MAG: hypothetical protein WAU02_02465 [Candidatus Saccharimonadales bacterium]
MSTPLTFESLSHEWSRTDSEGLQRVVRTDSFAVGSVVVAKISLIAEDVAYYPEVLLQRERVIITIDDSDEVKAFALAARIDTLLDETTS